MSMNEMLDQFYGTTKTASARPNGVAETEKAAEAAEVQLFLKLAGEEGIDVDSMLKSDEGRAQVDQLWQNFQKHAAAAREFEQKKEASGATADTGRGQLIEQAEAERLQSAEMAKAAEDLRRADFCGRTMAHAYVQELRKIASGDPTPEAEAAALKLAEFPPPKKDGDKDDDKKDEKKDDDKKENPFAKKEASAADRLKNLGAAAAGKAKDYAGKAGLGAGLVGQKAKYEAGRAAKATTEFVGKNKKTIGTHAAAGAAGAAAGAAARGKKKESSAIDMLAAERAVEKVAQWVSSTEGATEADVEAAVTEAAQKIAAADVLDLFEESEKIGFAQDLETAVDWRACELLERVGYPIDWPQ